MTDRHAGYIITLERDIREDDAETTITALRQIKGVASVEPIVSDVESQLAMSRARNYLAGEVFTALTNILHPGARTITRYNPNPEEGAR